MTVELSEALHRVDIVGSVAFVLEFHRKHSVAEPGAEVVGDAGHDLAMGHADPAVDGDLALPRLGFDAAAAPVEVVGPGDALRPLDGREKRGPVVVPGRQVLRTLVRLAPPERRTEVGPGIRDIPAHGQRAELIRSAVIEAHLTVGRRGLVLIAVFHKVGAHEAALVVGGVGGELHRVLSAVAHARSPRRRLPDVADRRQQQCDQHRDDRDDDQHLRKGEAMVSHHAAPPSTGSQPIGPSPTRGQARRRGTPTGPPGEVYGLIAREQVDKLLYLLCKYIIPAGLLLVGGQPEAAQKTEADPQRIGLRIARLLVERSFSPAAFGASSSARRHRAAPASPARG